MPSARHLVHRPGTALHPAELTLAHTVPAMAELIPLAEQSRAEAERAIDGLWTPVPALVSGIRHPRGGTSTEVTPTPHTVSDAALAPASGTWGGAYHGAGPAAARLGERVEVHCTGTAV